MIAGSVAGIVEHTAMYPVDTIKTRMQALSHPGQRVRGPLLHYVWLGWCCLAQRQVALKQLCQCPPQLWTTLHLLS